VTKVEKHRRALAPLLDAYLCHADLDSFYDYLVFNSGLPGRRANLELAFAFGDEIADRPGPDHQRLWTLCTRLVEADAACATANTPEEFPPFCGTIGIGTIGAHTPGFYQDALARLRCLANDPRWRMREAVCFGLQRLLAGNPWGTLKSLQTWAETGRPLEMRAAAAAVADPPLLADENIASKALELHEKVFERFTTMQDRKTEGFRVLRKGLAFTLSVVVPAVPAQGFALLRQLAASEDPDLGWILVQNLKKNRLRKPYPQEIAEIQELLV
jgi:hypothetical protein